MLKKYFTFLLLVVASMQVSNNLFAQTEEPIIIDSLKFTIGTTILNQSLWSQPYRYENKNLKTLSIKITVERLSKESTEINYNLFSLLVASKEMRVRPTGLFYYKSTDKKKYLRTSPLNHNYDVFQEFKFEDFENFEAKTYDPNFLGRPKKGQIPTVKQLKTLKLKKRKLTYHIDFPSYSKFTQGKLYYKGKTIGIVRVER